MAYERFYQALEGLEDHLGDWDMYDFYPGVTQVFGALFDPYPYGLVGYGLAGRHFDDRRIEDYKLELQQNIEELRRSIEAEGYQIVRVGDFDVVVGPPTPLPTVDMLERLKSLPLPDTTYKPDGDDGEDDFDEYVEVLLGIAVRGAILYVTWLLSGYGDDLQPTHSELENLLTREGDRFIGWEDENDDGFYVRRIYSLSRRIAAELAYQRGNYVEALTQVGQSAMCLKHHHVFEEYPFPLPRPAPWLAEIENQARKYIDLIERNHHVVTDWKEIANACEVMSRCFVDLPYDKPIILDSFLGTPQTFWSMQKGRALDRLTPDAYRDMRKNDEKEAAQNRLQAYFFPDGIWEKLSKRAQQALVTADEELISIAPIRRDGIANEIRIATEEVLNQYLWLRLSKWAAGQSSLHPGVKELLDKPKQQRRNPSIDDCVQLLWHSGARDYFQSLGLSDNDVQFLTKENRTTLHLEKLRRTRNRAEHERGSTISSVEIRELYAESLGIGRQGFLPKLLRLLAKELLHLRPPNH